MGRTAHFEAFHNHLRQVKHLNCLAGLAKWDQEVNMPEAGAEFRSEQLAYLAGMAHTLLTDGRLADLIQQVRQSGDMDDIAERQVSAIERDLEKTTRLPKAFVERFSKAVSNANQAWAKAREDEDFRHFQPALKHLVALNQEKAQYYGYQTHIYDALLDDYEPGLTTNVAEDTLQKAKRSLSNLLKGLQTQAQPPADFLYRYFPVDQQKALNRQVAAELGFDYHAGELNTSTHPFTISFSPQDVRITTRFFPNDFAESLGSTIHETGHALYEQGFLSAHYGLPSGEAISLGIHESQSRLWENHVGRSRAFVKGFLPLFKQYFPEQLGNIGNEEFYRAFNRVQPSLIRTAADEVTYHLHIAIRTELEKAMLEERLSVEDLPEAWNQAYRDHLGLIPPDLKHGVLQDIHWAHGALGYFPTYSLGSFYAAQFFQQAQNAIPDLDDQLARRQTAPLLNWLRENLHQHGRLYQADEICEAITGEPLRFAYFESYIYTKYQELYNLT